MVNNSKKKIAIVWEGYEAGGVDSYLSYLLNSWPVSDDITIFYNKENLGITRLKSLIKIKNIDFVKIPTTIMFFDGKSTLSLVCKYINHLFIPIFFICSIFKYRRIFKKYKFQVLVAQNGGYPGSYGVVSSIFGAHLAKIKMKSLVIHHRANNPILGHKIFRSIIERKLSSILSSVIAISNATKKTILSSTNIFKLNPSNIIVIENGVEVHKKEKDYSFERDNYKIGIIGRLDPHKGHDDFIIALSMLNKSLLKKIKVDFIGGYKEDDFLRISALIKEYSLEQVVTIRGYVEKNTIDIICELDLVAMVTKDFEGFGLTIAEALFANVPVLATRVGIVPELFHENDPLIVDPEDIVAISSAIEDFITREDKLEFISKYTKNKLSLYNSVNMASRYRSHLIGTQDY